MTTSEHLSSAEPGVFVHPYAYWVGTDTDPAGFDARAEHRAVERVSTYELLDPDPRGGIHRGPRWLRVYETADEAAALEVADHDVAGNAVPDPMWRIVWRQISTLGSADALPVSIWMVGMDVPEDTDADELVDFNVYYDDVHVPETMELSGYARGTRFERHRVLEHPEPGCPQFCAVYEADAAATDEREARRPPRDAFSPGPRAWEAHFTVWRLVYRRIDTAGSA